VTVYERFTIEALDTTPVAVSFALAAGRHETSPADLAAALVSRGAGNATLLWTPGPPPPAVTDDSPVRIGEATKAILAEAHAIARYEGADHVGTEHLAAALVRTGPPDAVALLAERGATAKTVDALLATLGGGIGAEHRPISAARPGSKHRRPFVLTLAVMLLVLGVPLIFCIVR
jgi:hypothetical protein